MYGKLENGVLLLPPNPVVADGTQIFNPPASVLAALGYVPVVQTPQPEDGQVYDCRYELQNGQPVQVWTAAALPADAVLAVLTGEV